jgi:hypothetical protein
MRRATVKILFVCFCVMTFGLAANAATPTTGKFDIYFEITINSALPSDAPISCTLTVSVEGEPNLFEDSMSVAGIRTGNHATCTVPMYYSWLLNNPGSDILSLSYTVVDAGQGLPYRQDSQSATIPVPPNGTASHIYVTVVL